MAKGTVSVRGWVCTIFVAVSLSVFFWFAQRQMSNLNGMNSDSGRSFTASSRSLTPDSSSANAFPDIVDVTLLPKDSAWSEYKSRPGTSLAKFVEPTATVSLMAPQLETSQEEWLAQNEKRSPSKSELLVSMPSEFQTAAARIRKRPSPSASVPSLPQRTSSASFRGPARIWPTPRKLSEQLRTLETLLQQDLQTTVAAAQMSSDGNSKLTLDAGAFQNWIDQTRQQLRNIENATGANDSVKNAIVQISELADSMLHNSTAANDSQIGELVARTAYSMKRRAQLWNGVYACLQADQAQLVSNSKVDFSADELLRMIAQIEIDSKSTGDVAGWNNYLQLDRLAEVAKDDVLTTEDILAVRRFLDRVSWSGVTSAQRYFLDSTSVRAMANYVQPLAITPIDYSTLLHDFEMLEDEPLHRCSQTIVMAMESLRYSSDANQIALAQAINVYYRNANIRFAVSAELMNRLLPNSSTTVRPVRQRILGADTTGGSSVSSKLELKLVPNPNAWQVKLNLLADVSSRTASEKGPAVVHNTSQMRVASDREITITPETISVNSSQATVDSTDRVRGVETDFDGIPIVADLVRYFVDREVASQRPLARRITSNMVAKETDQEFDSQLEEKLQLARTQMQDRWTAPLQFIGLDSEVVDLQTTDTRLIGRYRIASHDALAAHTPRPQAPSDSHFSVQIHQSAFNNACNQLKLGNRDWALPELVDELSRRLNLELVFDREDLPENAVLRFEDDNPIAVEFADDTVWLTLRIAKLNEPGRIDLNNFIIRVSYECHADGLSADLVRTGAISVDGERLGMRDRLPLRAIFGRIFASHSKINLIDHKLAADPRFEGLSISQVVAREGWLALAVSPATSAHVAILQKKQDDNKQLIR